MAVERIVVVGAGLAGVTAADALRDAGFEGELLLFGEELEAPYDKPPLSKSFLMQTIDPQQLALRPPEWYPERRITYLAGRRVTRIEPRKHLLQLDGGSELRWDRLLLTTGARPRCLPALASGAAPCLYLRTLRDASLLREQLAPGRRILLIGGGVIGMELAASARQRDCEVVVLERAQRIMERALCPVLSDYLVSRHESEGVEVMTGVEAVCQSTDVPGVQLRDGRTIRGDAIVIGVGVAPNTELASEAGLFCEDGICVDAHGETSAPDVFAAGDVVSYPDSILGRRVRGENWMHAKSQAACVARGMVGAKTPYREVPHLWSDQFDLKIQVSGSYRGDRDILRGSLASKRFMIFHVKADHVVGASGVNQARDMKFATKLVDIRARVDAAQLADPNFDLKKALQQ